VVFGEEAAPVEIFSGGVMSMRCDQVTVPEEADNVIVSDGCVLCLKR